MHEPIVVVGGGLAGLVAAHHLRHTHGVDDLILLEAAHEVGGKALTTPFAGRPLDCGPDAFLARSAEALELCTDLGLAEELVSPAARRAMVLLDGRLTPLPEGLVLGVPVDAEGPGLASVLSAAGRARVAAEPSLPPEPSDVLAHDETVGGFLRRRMGDEVVDRLVGPLLGGVNAGSADELSIEAGAPQLASARRAGGSFTDALRRLREAGSDPGAPVFVAHPEGMGHLVRALADRLAPDTVRTGVRARAVHGPAGGDRRGPWQVLWHDHQGRSGTTEAAAVVLAVPSPVSARLLADLAPTVATGLDTLAWASVAVVALAYPRATVADPLEGSGFLVPERAGRLLTACSWASSKWAHLGGDGTTVVLRASTGRIRDARHRSLTDAALVAAVHADLVPLLGLETRPVESRVSRWPRSLPQFRPGHLERVAAWEQDLADLAPGVVLAGASLRGLGIPAVITSGRQAADRVAARLTDAADR